MPRPRPVALVVFAAALFSSQNAVRAQMGCRGDFNADRVVNSSDFFEYMRAFFEGHFAADFNGDASVDSRDFFDYLVTFFALGGECPKPGVGVPLVIASRQINDRGTIYWDVPRDMPGVGPHSRVRPAGPSRLLVLEADGALRTLIDGSNPSAETLELIDFGGVDVSYDAKQIVFAGLPAGEYSNEPASTTGAWRIYTMNVDGTNLRQVTFSDQEDLDRSQFGEAAGVFWGYDDFDPTFLPDGRICFSSTRWYSIAHYSGVRTSNLFVVNADGSRLHRITSERNGAERPLVDPVTGRIVYSRWWRNHRFPIDSMETIEHGTQFPAGGFDQHLGLTTDRNDHVGAPGMWRNFWQIASIGTDGDDVKLWAGRLRSEPDNHFYGGAFTPSGLLYANFFPMFNMTEAGGFGGIRRYTRAEEDGSGSAPHDHVIGVTELTLEYVHNDPPSYGVFSGNYAAEPEVLPDGRLLISWAPNVMQDYGLYTINPDGSRLSLVYDVPGMSEVRAKAVTAREIAPVLADRYRDDPAQPAPRRLPPTADGPYEQDGTFTFAALNVYANAPVDADIVSAPPVGSAGTIRFFIDHQRTSPGSFPNLDWPILLAELPVSAAGAATNAAMPANVPLFEQLRSAMPEYRVPRTGGPYVSGAAHVAGMNFALAGSVTSCVGCHTGHTQMPVPKDPAAALWSNLAPGAAVNVSSSRDANYDGGLIDRKAMKGEIWRYWNSAPGEQDGQWVSLTFAVPVSVREVRLYNPRFGDEANSSIQVEGATVVLYADAEGTQEAARASVGELSVSGTSVAFEDVRARVVRVNLDRVRGTFYGMRLAALAEIEVIARGEAP